MKVLFDILGSVIMLPGTTLGAGIAALSLLGALIFRHYHRPRSCTRAFITDWAALLYVIMQLIPVTYSKARPNTVHFLVPYVSALCIYVAIRLCLPWPVGSTKLILRFAVILGVGLAFADLTLQLQSMHAASKLFMPSSLSSLRASLPILGIPTKNDGLALVLAVLPFALAGSISRFQPNRYFCLVSTLLASCLVTVLVLGFSRAIYISLALLVIGFLVLSYLSKAVSFKRLLAVIAGIGVVVGAAVLCVRAQRPVADTILCARTISQQMSTQGRLTIWRESLSTIAGHPILGNGGGVDGILALKRLRYSGLPFTARTYNAPLDVLTSSGLIGFVLYTVFLIYPLWCAIRTSSHPRPISSLSPLAGILAAGIVATIVRDATYSSLVTNGATIVAVWVMVALVQNAYAAKTDSRSVRAGSWNALGAVACIALGLSCVSIVLSYRLERAEAIYRKGSAAFVSGSYSQARTEFSRAIQIEPEQPIFYSADGLAAVDEVLRAHPPSSLWQSLPLPTKDEEGMFRAAELDFRTSVRLSGDDSAFWSDLGWVEALRGEESEATASFERAIQVDPRNAVSRISAGLQYERLGLKAKAFEQYASAIAAQPGIVDSSFFKDLSARDSDVAKLVVERAVELLEEPPTSPVRLASLAKLHAFLGEKGLAHDEYIRALGALPDLSYTWGNLGVLDLEQGNAEIANREFKRALFLDRSNRSAANMLASVDLVDGRVDTAKELYARAILMPEISAHAERAWRLYHIAAPAPDDLLPQRLLVYTSPRIQQVRICDKEWLAELSETPDVTPDVSRRIAAQEDFCSARQMPGK